MGMLEMTRRSSSTVVSIAKTAFCRKKTKTVEKPTAAAAPGAPGSQEWRSSNRSRFMVTIRQSNNFMSALQSKKNVFFRELPTVMKLA